MEFSMIKLIYYINVFEISRVYVGRVKGGCCCRTNLLSALVCPLVQKQVMIVFLLNFVKFILAIDCPLIRMADVKFLKILSKTIATHYTKEKENMARTEW